MKYISDIYAKYMRRCNYNAYAVSPTEIRFVDRQFTDELNRSFVLDLRCIDTLSDLTAIFNQNGLVVEMMNEILPETLHQRSRH